MQNQSTALLNKRNEQLIKFIAASLILVYLINCFSPLRLHVDMLRYFAIKDCIELGCPPDSEAAKDYLPYGYTGLLLLLSKIGLLNSFVIVFINCAFLFGSIYLAKKIFDLSGKTYLFIAMVLLNWTTIKFTTHPLSEMQYLFFSMASLYYFCKFTSTRSFVSLFLSFISAGLAFLTRSVGVALAAALVAGVIWQYKEQLLLLIRKNKVVVLILLIIIAGVAIFSKQLGLDHYTGVFSKQFDEGVGFKDILGWHFTEWSELIVNTSQSKVAAYLPDALSKTGFIVTGIIFFCVFVFLLFRNKKIPFIVKAYLVFYSVLMFNWPFYDPRFWVPVLPLMAAVVIQSSFPVSKLSRGLQVTAFAVYMLIGVVSIGYMTYTSLNKKDFARTQANGVYRNEYETVFFGKPHSDTARHINQEVLHVIERYSR